MTRLILRILLLSLAVAPIAGAERLYFNDKKAPESREDLLAIQKALTRSLAKAREATVCIDIGDGSGSGVIVSPEGLILTAAHVSTGVGRDVTVIMEDGRKLKGETLGLVADVDAAMIKITEKGTYPFAEIDKDAATNLGDWVFSLGHSGGFDKERGSVVRLGRLVRIANSTIQTDCSLIGGDSGGPLFDLNGKVIGIHSRVGERIQVNMHVPTKEFISNWDGMMKSEFIGEGPFAQKPEKGSGFLGLATDPKTGGGLKVTKVGRETPAEKAGFKEGDVLMKFNGTDLTAREQFQDLIKEMAAYDKVEIEILRDGKPQTFKLKLGERH
ncbi:MAG TPA: trypsin-like peptidase domain-containing protein [Luteolibacter sp.]|nr:trypsin-like peptidase domain-containing protein [Luteolibacter sp.]